MTDFRMDKSKPVSNNAGTHANGNEEKFINSFGKIINKRWVAQEHLAKARLDQPFRPGGLFGESGK